MLTYSFSNIGSEHLYEHLYKCLKNDILTGVLPAGSKLPSKRGFAANLGISPITVENAYAQLLVEGYIFSLPRKGFFVAENIIPCTVSAESGNTAAESGCQQEWFADFCSNQTEPERFPFSVWTKLLREVCGDRSRQLMTNSPASGVWELRQAIAGFLRQFRAMDIDPERIVVGAGTEYLYGLLIQLLGRDKVYGLEDPGYPKLGRIYNSFGVERRYIPLNNGVPDHSLISSGVQVMHISPAHHYPTGSVMPVSARYELLAWAAEEEGRYIIEDDYDSEFRLSGQPIPTLQSIDVTGKVIYLNTFAKSLSSTLRISYMVLPQKLAERFRDRLSFYSCPVGNFEQYTLARFIRDGYFEKHINRMRNHYRRKRDILLQAFANSGLPADSVLQQDAGLHFLLSPPAGRSDEELAAAAAAEGIKVSFLSQYYHDPAAAPAPQLAVINYSSIDGEKTEEAVHRLLKAFGCKP